MDSRAKSALLWGSVGGLTFLVLLQGAVALEAVSIPLLRGSGMALVVAAVTGVVTHRYERRLAAWASERGR